MPAPPFSTKVRTDMVSPHQKLLDRAAIDAVVDFAAAKSHRVSRGNIIAVLQTAARWVKRDGTLDLTIDQLCDMTGLSRSVVQRVMAATTSAGYCETISRGGSPQRHGTKRRWFPNSSRQTPSNSHLHMDPRSADNSSHYRGNPLPGDTNSTPQGIHSHYLSQRTSHQHNDERFSAVVRQIAIDRAARSTTAIGDPRAWQRKVERSIATSDGQRIQHLLETFPDAPIPTIAYAIESGDGRGLAVYAPIPGADNKY